MKMLRGLFMSASCIWVMPTPAMRLNMTQNRPLTMAWGIDANRPPNFPDPPQTQQSQMQAVIGGLLLVGTVVCTADQRAMYSFRRMVGCRAGSGEHSTKDVSSHWEL
jgi:hypothetical protein